MLEIIQYEKKEYEDGLVFLSSYGGRNGIETPEGLVKIGKDWFLCSRIHGPMSSMIEALSQTYIGGGMSIQDTAIEFSRFGVNLSDCANDNYSKTMDFLQKRCSSSIRSAGEEYLDLNKLVVALNELLSGVEDRFTEIRELIESTIKKIQSINK